MLQNVDSKRLSNIVMLLAVVLGAAIALFGVYEYSDAEQKIDDNRFYQLKQKEKTDGEIVAGEDITIGDADDIYNSSQEYKRLLNQRGQSPRYIGVGLAVIAVAWIGRDFIAGQRKKNAPADPDSLDETPQSPSTAT
jgi:hypothetical protein